MTKLHRPHGLALMLALAGLAGCGDSPTSGAVAEAPGAKANWVATWHSGVIDAQEGTDNITYRLSVHNALGGETVRLRFSNRYGVEPVTLRNVNIALPTNALKLPMVDAATVTAVSFEGKNEASIPVGGELRSDPVSFSLPADADVAVTYHVPTAVTNVTGKRQRHTISWSTLAGGGDATADYAGTSFVQYEVGSPFLTTLEVDAPGATTVVAFGDSITDGAFQLTNSDQRWPDLLNDRLKTSDLAGKRSVINAGISGNMVTGERSGNASEGQRAVMRMAWDVFDQPNVSHLIVFEGINDVSVGVPAPAIIDGVRAIIAEAHRRGIQVIVSTLTPSFGATGDYGGSTLNEGQRGPFNDWVLNSGEPDAVIDFNAAVSTGLSPETWLPPLTLDYLHPNPLGLMVMADSIPLDVLR